MTTTKRPPALDRVRDPAWMEATRVVVAPKKAKRKSTPPVPPSAERLLT